MSGTTFLDGCVTMHVGDVFERLAAMEPDSVDCVVTSPPYWGLRSYIRDGDPLKPLEIGLEPTLGEHLDVMVRVFEAVRRVLKPSGTCWVNYGDCYATTPNGRPAADVQNDDRTFRDKPFSTIGPIYDPNGGSKGGGFRGANLGRDDLAAGIVPKGRVVAGGMLKAKDLCMVPNRLAIALQENGWWVRSEIIWAKANPMPESIRDRPATSHEKIFMLTKAARYWYDKDAVKQKSATSDPRRPYGSEGAWQMDGRPEDQRPNGQKRRVKVPGGRDTGEGGHGTIHRGGRGAPEYAEIDRIETRNLRNYEPAPVQVWNFATQPFPDAHFATFPPELAERCILAGCPKGGTVLDPFGGSGTTALVALRHHRCAALIELNPEYAEMARARIEAEWRVQRKPTSIDLGPLFSGDAA